MDAVDILAGYQRGDRTFFGLRLLDLELLQAHLNGTNFSRSDLRQSRLGRTHFTQADLSEALLWGADFADAHCVQTQQRQPD